MVILTYITMAIHYTTCYYANKCITIVTFTWFNVVATYEKLIQLCITVYTYSTKGNKFEEKNVRKTSTSKTLTNLFWRNITRKGLVGKTLTNHYPLIKSVKALCHIHYSQ